MIGDIFREIRFALRALVKARTFTVVAVLTLALAIGANSVVFGIWNAAILRPLNVPNESTLVAVERDSDHFPAQSYPDYVDLRQRNRTFEDLAAWNFAQAGVNTGNAVSRVWVLGVTGNYFDVMGIKPYLGRFLHTSDEHGPNSAPYIVLSYEYWHTHFEDDRNAVGRVVRINKHPFTILGVAPPQFHGALLFFFPDLYVPIVNQEQVEGFSTLNDRANRSMFMVLGHLKPGLTQAQAIADLDSIGADLERTYPKIHNKLRFALAPPSLTGDYLRRPVKAFLTALMFLGGMILLAACANLGSLFAAHTADRALEVTLRLAIGSSRRRILRSFLIEAMLISLVGGTVGLLGSAVLLGRLSAWRPVPRWPIHVPVTPDVKVYLLALALAVVSAMLFGIVPIHQLFKLDLYQIIKSGARTTGRRRIPVRDIMVIGQIAICAVLVTASIVALRGLNRSVNTHFGFEPHNAVVMETVLDMAGYRDSAVPNMQRRMVEAVETIPGVQQAALVSPLPLETWVTMDVFSQQATDLRPSNSLARPDYYTVSPQYFRAAGTALVSGRDFTRQDNENTPRVAIVNIEFARKLFGSASQSIGAHFKAQDGALIQVVGVVEDGKYELLTEDPKPAMFFPMLQSPTSDTYMVVRSNRSTDPIGEVREVIRKLDPGLPVYLQTWTKEMGLPLFPALVASAALSVLGVISAILAGTGIFGLAAYSVSRRMRDLGIRLALGAKSNQLLWAALGGPFRLLAAGSAAGLILGIMGSGVLAHIVYQATPRDPLVLGGVLVAMLLLGLLGTWLPAQRALTIDPAKLLHQQ